MELGSPWGRPIHTRLKLTRKARHQLHACPILPVVSQTLSIVPQRQTSLVGRGSLEANADGPGSTVKGILEAVRDELGGNDAQRHGNAWRYDHRLKLGHKSNVTSLLTVELKQCRGQHAQIPAKIDTIDFAHVMQLVMDQSQRLHAMSNGRQFSLHIRVLGSTSLDSQEARNNLKVVFHPVLEFVQQPILFFSPDPKL
jgi:hypothetical protein